MTGFPWNLWVYSFSWATEIIQILEIVGLFAFNLISITIFMIPALFLTNIKLIKKLIYFFSIIVIFFLFYIYGNYSLNHNKQKLEAMDKKFNIKVISPNFKLEYGLTIDDLETRLEKLIRYSDPSKNLRTLFVWPEGVFSGYSFKEIQK